MSYNYFLCVSVFHHVVLRCYDQSFCCPCSITLCHDVTTSHFVVRVPSRCVTMLRPVILLSVFHHVVLRCYDQSFCCPCSITLCYDVTTCHFVVRVPSRCVTRLLARISMFRGKSYFKPLN